MPSRPKAWDAVDEVRAISVDEILCRSLRLVRSRVFVLLYP